jgi:hypothetical protein
LDCPGCGLTRSFCALGHGHLHRAWDFHWLGPLFFAFTALAVPMLVIEAIRGRRVGWFNYLLYNARVAWVVAGLLAVHWLVKAAMATRSGEMLTSVKGSVAGRIVLTIYSWIA